MSAMPEPSSAADRGAREHAGTRQDPPPPVPGAGERLCHRLEAGTTRVYCLVIMGLVAVLVLVIGVITRATLVQQDAVINELKGQVSALEQAIAALRTLPDGTRPRALRDEPGAQVAPPPAVEGSVGWKPPPEVSSDQAEGPTPATGPSWQSGLATLSEDAVLSALDEMLSPDPATPADVIDPFGAAGLLEAARRSGPAGAQAAWSGSTWARLAVLARLVGAPAVAEACAERARASGDPLVTYREVMVREALACGRPEEALPLARELAGAAAAGPPRPAALVLLTAAYLRLDEPASADETLDRLPQPLALDLYDRLLLSRAYLALERWSQLETTLRGIREVPQWLHAEHNFLVAVSYVHAGRTVEALALLDALAAPPLAAPEDQTAQTGSARWPQPGPDRYEVEVWRGVALTHARQMEVARQVLQQAAELDPVRPEAQYFLGVLEARAGRADVAATYLKNALAISRRMASAWEALAVLAIEADQVDQALEYLGRAISANRRRASAHFLMAIAHAKLSREERALEALRTALSLDGSLLAEAQQTDVLLRLLTPEEMAQLAAQ